MRIANFVQRQHPQCSLVDWEGLFMSSSSENSSVGVVDQVWIIELTVFESIITLEQVHPIN